MPQEHEDTATARLPVDPDLPTDQPRLGHRAGRLLRNRWDILAAISGGGALGSAARYGVAEALPHQPGQIAWATVAVNVSGGFLLGLLMVFVVDVWPPTRYVRPFLGVGILGGFTTFSTYMVDTRNLLVSGRPSEAALYLLGTLLVGLVAVWLGMAFARTISRMRHHGRRGPEPTSDVAHPPPTERSTS